MKKTITIVCGLGRSGTSLMMRMLSNGGMPIYCSDPILLETPHSTELPAHTDWLKDCEGAAVKILDPQRHRPPKEGYHYRFIWMYRDLEQQALSHLKFQSKLLKLPIDNPRGRKRDYMRTMQKETDQALKLLSEYGMPSIKVRFEDLLTQPKVEAYRIKDFITDTPLDVQKMVCTVIERPTKCYDGFLEEAYAGKKEL